MFLDFYQHIPEYINPIAFSIGFFSIRWYSLMYLVGLGVVYFLLKQSIIRKKLSGKQFSIFPPEADQPRAGNFPAYAKASAGKQFSINFQFSNDQFQKLFLYIFIGILIGGRLGYVLFYDLTYFIQNPLEIFLPLNIKACYMLHATCYSGFCGMSYHGGLIGAILAGIIFAGKYKINFWKLADWVASAAPAGYFFGRVGNFLNNELYGRMTDMPWGMYFSGQLRHPSQLYEAFFEGIVLFLILCLVSGSLKNKYSKYYFPGFLFSIYLFGYGLFRFILEFFREPDTQIGFIFSFLTMGQILSIGMIALAVIIFWKKDKKIL